MKKFEYELVLVEVDKNYQTYLNNRGQQGWQIAAQHFNEKNSYFITFMREIEQPKEQPINYKHNHSIDQTCWMDCPLRGTPMEVR